MVLFSLRRIALLPLGLLVVAAAPALAQEQTETRRFSISQQVRRLVVDSDRGRVSVAAGTRSHITAVLRWDITRPEVTYQVRDGVLRVVSRCPQTHQVLPRVDRCSVDLTITVPRGAATEIDTSYGDVAVRDMRANQEIRTAYGDVRLDRVTATTIRAVSSYGHMTANVNARVLRLESSYGDIAVTVPRGRYDVDTRTSYGSTDVDNLTLDSRAPRKISCHTSYGDITVSGR